MSRARITLLSAVALGAAVLLPSLASAGTHWDTVCNCRKPDREYDTRRVVYEKPLIITRKRVVNHDRVIKRVHLVQENREITHVRPVIHRDLIVHRQNVVYRDIYVSRKPRKRRAISYRD
jgi:hypothetical protein